MERGREEEKERGKDRLGSDTALACTHYHITQSEMYDPLNCGIISVRTVCQVTVGAFTCILNVELVCRTATFGQALQRCKCFALHCCTLTPPSNWQQQACSSCACARSVGGAARQTTEVCQTRQQKLHVYEKKSDMYMYI